MFRIGDKVVCIDRERTGNEVKLTLNKIYDVISIQTTSSAGFISSVVIMDDVGRERRLFQSRFVLLKEYRKQKLKRVLYENSI